MLSLVEVKCPHCGARGQVVIPPFAAFLVGPCPQCREFVVVFCGRVFPLNREIMTGDDVDLKHSHLMSVLHGFLEEQISELINDLSARLKEDRAEARQPHALDAASESDAGAAEAVGGLQESISQAEYEQFVEVDLKLLDNRDYFRAVFGE